MSFVYSIYLSSRYITERMSENDAEVAARQEAHYEIRQKLTSLDMPSSAIEFLGFPPLPNEPGSIKRLCHRFIAELRDTEAEDYYTSHISLLTEDQQSAFDIFKSNYDDEVNKLMHQEVLERRFTQPNFII